MYNNYGQAGYGQAYHDGYNGGLYNDPYRNQYGPAYNNGLNSDNRLIFPAMGMGGMGYGAPMNNPNTFVFTGNSLSLQARLDTITNE